MQVPTELEGVLHFILPVVSQYKKCAAQEHAHAELELRLGQRVVNEQGERVWQPNVSAPQFHTLLDLLRDYKHWSQRAENQDSHDYFYTLTDGSKVRTTAAFQGRHVEVSHMSKKPVVGVDLKLLHQACDARVSLKCETPVDASLLPDMVQPYLVRIKRRHSFWLEKWRFDLTQVWSGVTRGVAEANQCRNFCTYEVEVECVYPPPLLATLTDEYVALSLLLKVWSLLGAGKPVRMVPLTGV